MYAVNDRQPWQQFFLMFWVWGHMNGAQLQYFVIPVIDFLQIIENHVQQTMLNSQDFFFHIIYAVLNLLFKVSLI